MYVQNSLILIKTLFEKMKKALKSPLKDRFSALSINDFAQLLLHLICPSQDSPSLRSVRFVESQK